MERRRRTKIMLQVKELTGTINYSYSSRIPQPIHKKIHFSTLTFQCNEECLANSFKTEYMTSFIGCNLSDTVNACTLLSISIQLTAPSFLTRLLFISCLTFSANSHLPSTAYILERNT
ncbi:LOW QUALITY PROTEIN: hypothetical protein TorRG33x02_143140 [Trema orientale]|uniref:Uncharacterized protein n=1 Tax=Trema orientale TaxID=63057 RepID=A0A2P5EWW3_TREOI|nr:LOW QUALITY PROTEIN: hypothetical protein TorRG33x02_143140 [Trema orientale]